ncbi:MAG: hypothetical protein J5758_00945 [Abditibacteriota bacterium]|nr:hypothetical protein [Abditibacteriota bacterium]
MKYLTAALLLWLICAAPLFAAGYRSETLKEQDIRWFDAAGEPFRVYGLYLPDREHPFYYRVPGEVAGAVSPVFAMLSRHTAGGRVRFATDSPYVAVHVAESDGIPRTNLTLTFSNGLDLYTGKKQSYAGTYMPPQVSYDGFDGILYIGSGFRTVTLNMPRYAGVKELLIGLKEGSRLERAEDYAVEKPLVFYGSSITQGECASRPGNTYEDIISRELDVNYINLGFSGNALGEQRVCDYIAGLDMSCFIMDYDHNAPTAEHLEKTHYNMYRTVRRARRDLPVILVSRPNPVLTEDNRRRLEIVRATYERAKREGDKHVYLVPGNEFMRGYSADAWTVDDTHPNDFGMVLMAKRLQSVLKPLLRGEK